MTHGPGSVHSTEPRQHKHAEGYSKTYVGSPDISSVKVKPEGGVHIPTRPVSGVSRK